MYLHKKQLAKSTWLITNVNEGTITPANSSYLARLSRVNWQLWRGRRGHFGKVISSYCSLIIGMKRGSPT